MNPWTVVIVLTILLIPAAGARTEDVLRGTLEFRTATMDGSSNVGGQRLGAAHYSAADHVGLNAPWDLRAARILVNWSREQLTGLGSSPNNPNESLATTGAPQSSAGEREYLNAHATGSASTAPANFLIVPRSAEFEVNESATLSVQASRGETWSAGKFSNRSIGGGPSGRQLTVDHRTTPGHPVLETRSPHRTTIRGDFTLIVWGPNVTIAGADQRHDYRSGPWYENVTGPQLGPRGASRTELWQLVRIEVAGGTLSIDHRMGAARWTAANVEVQTSGLTALEAARGKLQSKTAAFEPDGRNLQITGDVRQSLSAFASNTATMRSNVEAANAKLNMAASAKIPSSGPLASFGAWFGAGLVLTLFGIGAVVAKRRAWWPTSWAVQLEKAGEALARKRVGEAMRRSEWLIRKRPDAVASWVMWGESHLLERGALAVIGPLERAVEKLDRPSFVQFLLAVAYLELGNKARARRWLRASFRDQDFVQAFEGDATMQELRRALMPGSAVPVTDVAYG